MTDKSQSRERQYRKKPVVIEAMQFIPVDLSGDINKHLNHAVQLDDWLAAHQGEKKCRYVGNTLVIPTREGDMTATAGDWIIRGVKGELYPCKPDIFEATYEAALADQPAAAPRPVLDPDQIVDEVKWFGHRLDECLDIALRPNDEAAIVATIKRSLDELSGQPLDHPAVAGVAGEWGETLDAIEYTAKNCIKQDGMKTIHDLCQVLRDHLRTPAPSPAVGGDRDEYKKRMASELLSAIVDGEFDRDLEAGCDGSGPVVRFARAFGLIYNHPDGELDNEDSDDE